MAYARIRDGYRSWTTVLVIIGLLCTVITGCRGRSAPPADAAYVLDAMISAVDAIPSGYGRYFKAAPDTKQALSPTLLSALYGASARQWLGDSNDTVLDDAAIYLTEQQHPFELAVLRCRNQGDISGGEGSVLGICRSRVAAVNASWQGSEYEEVALKGTVVHDGPFVILVIAQEPELILKAAKKAIQQKR